MTITKSEVSVGGYKIITFTGDGSTTYTFPFTSENVQYLVVGGGGAGYSANSASTDYFGSGGGGGEVLSGTVSTGGDITITVGIGGLPTNEGGGIGSSGGNSAFGSILSSGGEAGAAAGVGGASGAEYAGGDPFGGAGSYHSAGGGGGNVAVGSSASEYNGGDAGAGTASSITGASIYYGYGGGGAGYSIGGAGDGMGGHGYGVFAGGLSAGTPGTGSGGGGGTDYTDADTYYITDYGIVADGSDETAVFAAALLYASTEGYTKVLFPSTGTIGINDYIETPENIELIGNGCTIKLIDYSTIDHEQGFFYLHEGSYCHGMVFDGNMDNQTGAPDATNGIAVYSDARFEDNEVHNVGAYSVFTYCSTNVTISGNTIHDSWQYGIGTGGEVGSYTDGVIENNTIYRCGEIGIKLRHCQDMNIEGNNITVSTAGSYPVAIAFSADGGSDNTTIFDNDIDATGTGSDGIGIYAASTEVHDNNTITFNTITHAGYAGMMFNFNNSTISNNTITYSNDCIVNTGAGNTLVGNTCTTE